MPKFDTQYQAYRRDKLHEFRNMDPDYLVDALGIDTDTLMDLLWRQIEEHIETTYEEEFDYGDEESEDC